MTPSPKECKHDRRWSAYSQDDLAEAINEKKSDISRWVKRGLQRWEARGNRHRYCIPCTLEWMSVNVSAAVSTPTPDDDLEISGSDSPGLERYRLAKAALAELDLEVRKGSLLSVDRVKDGLLRVATMIRRLGERLGKRYGNDATVAVNETIMEFERITIDEFSHPDNQAAD